MQKNPRLNDAVGQEKIKPIRWGFHLMTNRSLPFHNVVLAATI
jgi:hypothetical protein